MNRRGFLGLLGAAAAGIALDPERLLWTPGKKLISIPKPVLMTRWGSDVLKPGDFFTIEGHYAINPRTRLPWHPARLTRYEVNKSMVIVQHNVWIAS